MGRNCQVTKLDKKKYFKSIRFHLLLYQWKSTIMVKLTRFLPQSTLVWSIIFERLIDEVQFSAILVLKVEKQLDYSNCCL